MGHLTVNDFNQGRRFRVPHQRVYPGLYPMPHVRDRNQMDGFFRSITDAIGITSKRRRHVPPPPPPGPDQSAINRIRTLRIRP